MYRLGRRRAGIDHAHVGVLSTTVSDWIVCSSCGQQVVPCSCVGEDGQARPFCPVCKSTGWVLKEK